MYKRQVRDIKIDENLHIEINPRPQYRRTPKRGCESRNGSLQENKVKNINFKEADLRGTQFFKTSLSGIDLSNSNVDQIAVSLEDIKGAKINQMQAIDLIYLLGVKVVE